MDAYWQTYLDARLAQDEHDDIIIEPGAHQGPDFPGAASSGGEPMPLSRPILQIAELPAPFLLSPRFAHAASRPTAHEWLGAKRIERGVVCPFVHGSQLAHD